MALETSGAADQPCPDPSVHEKHHKLSEQASTAALYVTHPERGSNARTNMSSSDAKLSSRSAAASLKHARPQDLPSFPIVGINTANSAGQAAMLAKDYKMKDLWQPEQSAAGSRAALTAHKDAGKLNLWQPTASADGNSAARLAMSNKSLSPQMDYGYTKTGRNNALLAATKSQSEGRRRAGSTPTPALPMYPDSSNSAHNALNAATVSHRASTKPPTSTGREPDGWDSAAMQAARIKNIGDHVDREMFSERPPVAIEQQEQRDKAALRASAISMAKQMYEYQNRTAAPTDQAGFQASERAHFRAMSASSSSQTDVKQEAIKYIHLQDAAHKLAAERLAKVDKTLEAARYKEYYGYGNQPQRSRLSLRSRGRRRASSEPGLDDLSSDDDHTRARRVRNQTSQLNSALASVDAKKQQTDRENLLAAAQKRVQKSMHDMDEKVFQETGKVSQAMMDDWEAKARKRAVEDAEKRDVNRGKTHLGGGKYMETSEIEAIAQARLKPTFDEINDTAERKRARDEEARLDREEILRSQKKEKQKHREDKDEQKRIKHEEKVAVKEEKAAAKHEKEERKVAEREENARKSTEQRDERPTSADQEPRRSLFSRLSVKRKSRDAHKGQSDGVVASAAAGTTLAEAAEKVKEHVDNEKPSSSDSAAEPVPTTVSDQKSESIEEANKDLRQPVRATTPVTASRISLQQPDDATTPPVEPKKDSTLADDDPVDKQHKGVRGFFSKLRRRQSRNDDKPTIDAKQASEEKSVAVAGESRPTSAVPPAVDHESGKSHDEEPFVSATVSEPPALPQHIGTDGPINDPHHVSGLNGHAEPVSPSSYKRHGADDGDDADISSLSSSGLEEDDFHEGRTGRLARALGLGKRKDQHNEKEKPHHQQTEKAEKADGRVTDEDEEAGHDESFEEARDYVDPGLAPEPAFIGKKSSVSPVRETRFQEIL